jgi:hypothetical protein
MPLVSYRASAVASWSEIHEVAGRRHSAKQVLRKSKKNKAVQKELKKRGLK